MTDAVNRFLSYLDEVCDGCDRHVFVDSDGNPDTVAAGEFAEAMRDQFAGVLGTEIVIEQRVNVVRLHRPKSPEPALD